MREIILACKSRFGCGSTRTNADRDQLAEQVAQIHLVDLDAVGLAGLADGASTDERFMLNASGIPLLTQLGLSDLGITEKLEDGPVLPC